MFGLSITKSNIMKNGKTIQELAAELDRQNKNKRDFILPTNKIVAYAHEGKMEVAFDLTEKGDHFSGGLTENGHKQVGQFCNIPVKYYDLMKSSSAELLSANVKHWFEKSSDRRMVRSLDGNIRALLSDKYRRLDNFDLAQHILPMLAEAEAVVESCEVTENNLYIKAITEKVAGEVKAGDLVNAGVMIRNSEVGHGALAIKPFIFRKICNNGAVIDELAFRKYHAGRRNDELSQIEFKNDTLLAEDRAFWLKVRDLVSASMSQATFDQVIEKMRESTTLKVDQPQYAIELIDKRFGLGMEEQSNVLKHLIEGGDLSSWGLGNAITRTAHDVPSYDRATELESVGYQVMLGNWN